MKSTARPWLEAPWLIALSIATVAACGDGGQMGHGAGGHEEMNPPCDTDDQCEPLGPGNMCMGGVCMVMDTLGPAVEQPAPSEQDVGLTSLVDLDPSEDLFEAELVIGVASVTLGGVPTEVFAYGDTAGEPSIPGPLIDVVEGTTVRIRVTNRLDEPTSIHWHGLVLPVEMDGVPEMPVPPIAPGETLTYEFEARHPGLYWYHPHFRSDVQVERGLYGPLVIRPAGDDVPVDRERILVLDDVLLDESGAIEGPDTGSAHLIDAETGEITMTFESMMGRQGNRLLLNGRMNPILHARAGSVERWRLVNTANARFFRVALPGAQLRRIGGDSGLSDAAIEVDEILLAPAQRADVLVRFGGDPGTQFELVTRHYDRGHDMHDPGDLPLALVALDEEPVTPPTPFPTLAPLAIEDLPVGPVTHRVEMTEVETRGGRIGFALDGRLWPDVTPREAPLGEVQTWELVNLTHMDHPFHLHGTRFQVVDTVGEDGTTLGAPGLEGVREWTDTVLVPGEATVRFVTRFEDFPGTWMYHCHIFEHAERGMMGMVAVE